jgi:hypothetical protein
MRYVGSDHIRAAHAHAGDYIDDAPTLAGLIAAAAWAVGLAVGLCALIAGHAAVAAVAAVMGFLAPWLGLGWVVHGRHRVDNSERLFRSGPQQTYDPMAH